MRSGSDDVTRILIALHTKAEKLLDSKRKHYGDMMRKSLSFLINGWDDLIKYRKA